MDWAALAERHADRVYRAARAEAADDHAAWDCVQEAFATALKGGEPDRGDPVEWLCGVARNHARHWKRGESRWRGAIERLAARRPRSGPATADAQALREALVALPIKLRDAVSLRYLAGMSAEEVARAQGISASAAKMRVHRGLARLRTLLGGAALVMLLVGQAQAGTYEVAAALARRGHVGAAGLVTGFAMKKIALLGLALALLLAAGLLVYMRRGSGGTTDRSAREALARAAEPEPARPVEAMGNEAQLPPSSLVAYPAKRPLAPLRGVVVDELGEPVSDVAVSVQADFGGILPELAIADDRTVALSLRSAEDGSFGAELPTGPYRLAAKAADGREANARCAVTEPPEVEPMRLVVKAPRGANLSVTVVDRIDRPLEGAEVEVIAGITGTRVTGNREMPLLRGVTDVEGRCAFDVRPYSALVFATAHDGRIGWANATQGREGAEATRVQVDVPGALRGRLVGVDADLLRDTTVVAHALGRMAEAVYHAVLSRSEEVAIRDGAYSFERLAAGRYALTLDSPSGARLALPPFRCGRDDLENSVAAAAAEVTAGNTTVRDLEVVIGGTLRGTVTTAEGSPVAGALVSAVYAPRTWNFPDGVVLHGVHVWRLDSPFAGFAEHPEAHRRTRTGPDGRYELAGLQPGLHRVEVFVPGLAYDRRMDVKIKDGETTELRHALKTAGVLQGVTADTALIGVVVNGETLPRVLTSVAADGLFTLPGLPAGPCEVRAFHSDEARGSRLLAATEVCAGETTWLDLRSAGPVRYVCRVVDARGPVQGARARPVGRAWMRTGPGGEFAWHVAFPFERVFVQVEVGGLVWQYSLAGPVSDQGGWEGDVRLGEHAAVIRTLDPAGKPVASELTLTRSGRDGAMVVGWDGSRARIRVPAAGEAVLKGMHEGWYEVTASYAGGAETRTGFVIPSAEPLVLAAPRTGTVAVSLADAAAKPVAGIRVMVLVWRGEGPAPDDIDAFWNGTVETKWGATGPDGKVAVEGVPAGTALLFAADGERQWPIRRGNGPFVRYLRVEIPPETTLALDLVIGDPVLRDR